MKMRRALGWSAYGGPQTVVQGGPGFSAFSAPYVAPASAPAPALVSAPSVVPASAPAPIAIAQAQQNVPQMLQAQATQPNFVAAVNTPSNPSAGATQPFMNTSSDMGITAYEAPPDAGSVNTMADGWGLSSWFANLGPHSWLWILLAAAGVYYVAKDKKA